MSNVEILPINVLLARAAGVTRTIGEQFTSCGFSLPATKINICQGDDGKSFFDFGYQFDRGSELAVSCRLTIGFHSVSCSMISAYAGLAVVENTEQLAGKSVIAVVYSLTEEAWIKCVSRGNQASSRIRNLCEVIGATNLGAFKDTISRESAKTTIAQIVGWMTEDRGSP